MVVALLKLWLPFILIGTVFTGAARDNGGLFCGVGSSSESGVWAIRNNVPAMEMCV